MKKLTFFGLMASILVFSGNVVAEDAGNDAIASVQLTSKNYVDTGLRFVYDKARSVGEGAVGDAAAAQGAAEAAQSTADEALEKANTALANAAAAQATADTGVANAAAAQSAVGDMATLEMANTESLVDAINKLNSRVGKKNKLDAEILIQRDNGVLNKPQNLVEAINFVYGTAKTAKTDAESAKAMADGIRYTGTNGIVVDNDTKEVKLRVAESASTDGDSYVYRNGQFSKLDMIYEWDPS